MFESIRVVAGKQSPPEVIVLGIFQGEKLDPASLRYDAQNSVQTALGRAEATGEAGRLVEAFVPASKGSTTTRRIIIAGLGKKEAFSAGDLRTTAAAVGRRLAQTKEKVISVELTGPLREVKADAMEGGRAFGEGLGLVGWTCDKFKGKGTDAPKRTSLDVQSTDDTLAAGLGYGLALARSTNLARDLSQTPPNVATPMWMAEQAEKLAKELGLGIRIFEGKELEKERFAGLINVGKASENKPCMIRLEYTPGGGKPKGSSTGKSKKAGARPETAVLIGKTVCYDTGGLSLKVNNGMVGMKRDKDGGCAVLGAMHAIASTVKPDTPVVALLAAAENSVSDEAYRPDDIITFRNGVTVEVTNTDAEGRLVLADALCWACEMENPAFIVELSTLTGGVVTALGSTFAGMFCEDDALRHRLEQASAISGERVWRLPMHKEYRDMMKSPVADILNSNPNRKAHPIQGAAFLYNFVKDGIPFAHIDIAGVHVADDASGPFIKGPTGWGVRMLADLLAQE